jgi:hypothetical protein
VELALLQLLQINTVQIGRNRWDKIKDDHDPTDC